MYVTGGVRGAGEARGAPGARQREAAWVLPLLKAQEGLAEKLMASMGQGSGAARGSQQKGFSGMVAGPA